MSERKIELVLSDVDGTQADRGVVSPGVIQAAQELRRRETKLVEVTARSHALLAKLVEPLGLQDNLCVLDGGATIARAGTDDVLWSQRLGVEILQTIAHSIAPQCVSFSFDAETRTQKPTQVLAAFEQDQARSIDALAVFAVFEAGRSDTILEALGGISGIQSTRVMAYDKNPAWRSLQIVSHGVDKKSGTNHVRGYDELSGKRALLIGDGANDIPLLHAAQKDDVTAAINNRDTPPELLELADLVVPSVEEDGFVHAMRYYELI